MPRRHNPTVFFDANIVIAGGKPPGGPLLRRVIALANAGLIRPVTTDVTIREVAKKHTANDYDVIKEVGRPHFRALVLSTTGTKLPNISKRGIEDKISAARFAETSAMFAEMGAITLAVDEVSPSAIFEDYALGRGMFSGEGKRDQFPDAFIFARLQQEAKKFQPLIIVSDDGDFSAPVAADPRFIKLGSIKELFLHLQLEIDAPDVDTFLDEEQDSLRDKFNDELAGWGLQVSDVNEAEVDSTFVQKVELNDVTTFGSTNKGEDILVTGAARLTVEVTYTHPDWATASYDSEDKILIPHDDVEGETTVEIDVNFSMSIAVNEEGDPVEINDLDFTDDRFIYISIEQYDDYK